MTRLLSTLVLVSWSLWFGGLIAMFIFAQTLFAHSRELAMSANPILFHVFERYQLVLAGITLTAAGGLAALVRGRAATTAVIFVALATAVAVTSTMLVTSKMQRLYEAGQSSTPQFKRLHGQSMLLYTSSAVLLAGAGALVPGLCARANAPRREREQSD